MVARAPVIQYFCGAKIADELAAPNPKKKKKKRSSAHDDEGGAAWSKVSNSVSKSQLGLRFLIGSSS